MNIPKPKPIITLEEHPSGIAVFRDGDPLLTPKREVLAVPNPELAEAIAREFSDAEPAQKHFTKIAYTAIDLAASEYETLAEAMLAYLHTDSICYFAETPELAKRERMHWQPILDWASTHFACEFLTFEGVMPADQPEESVDAIRAYMDALDPWRVAVLLEFTRGFSSLLLALAVMEGRLNTETAFNCSQVDEEFQREEWGEDEEAMARRAKLKQEMLAAEAFLALL